MGKIKIVESDINDISAQQLIGLLDEHLRKVTGRDGTAHFKSADVSNDKSVFLMAYVDGKPFGCGALRRLDDNTAEVKRMFAKPNEMGIGSKILKELENKAKAYGFSKIHLETGKENTGAVNFYRRNGYSICDNYGPYVAYDNAVCFVKEI